MCDIVAEAEADIDALAVEVSVEDKVTEGLAVGVSARH